METKKGERFSDILVKQAVALDPLCSSVLDLEQVWAMCDEMFKALAPWMPQFAGPGARKKRTGSGRRRTGG